MARLTMPLLGALAVAQWTLHCGALDVAHITIVFEGALQAERLPTTKPDWASCGGLIGESEWDLWTSIGAKQMHSCPAELCLNLSTTKSLPQGAL